MLCLWIDCVHFRRTNPHINNYQTCHQLIQASKLRISLYARDIRLANFALETQFSPKLTGAEEGTSAMLEYHHEEEEVGQGSLICGKWGNFSRHFVKLLSRRIALCYRFNGNFIRVEGSEKEANSAKSWSGCRLEGYDCSPGCRSGSCKSGIVTPIETWPFQP